MRPDILVLDSEGRAVLIAEVKGKAGGSPQWAAEFRRNLLEGYRGSSPPFFLLATPDRFDFWRRASKSDLVPPDFSLNPVKLLKSYDSKESEAVARSLSGFALELIVADWLRALTHTDGNENGSSRWLSTSGLLKAIRGGQVLEQEV